jgi:N-acetyl-anhydromuramyl-L-alanine amidase AmpD
VGAEGLPIYDRSDVTADTDFRVWGHRANRPRGSLIHTTSGINSRKWLQGGSAQSGTPASADALIDRAGTQYILVGPEGYAYHAGKSQLQLERLLVNNQVSEALCGIELECLDNQEPTYAQYDSLAALMLWYAGLYNWRWPLVYYGHYSVARPIGRRSDPVNFNWGALAGRIYIRALAAKLPGLEP